jgi:hypothetical protein
MWPSSNRRPKKKESEKGREINQKKEKKKSQKGRDQKEKE